MELDGQMLRDKLEPTGVIKHIMPMVFSEQKDIWQIKTTKANIVEAMRHVKEVLEEIRQNLPDGEINKYSTFPYPRVLNTYAVPTKYAMFLLETVDIADNKSTYVVPPTNAWNNGPPRNAY
eukprot:1740466-Ditylum_brightwellii.AAC.1